MTLNEGIYISPRRNVIGQARINGPEVGQYRAWIVDWLNTHDTSGKGWIINTLLNPGLTQEVVFHEISVSGRLPL